jgi:hypothetical protein
MHYVFHGRLSMREFNKDMLYGFVVAALLIIIILFSSGTTKFVYIDF